MKPLPKICSVDGCGDKPVGRGLCMRHYKRLKRTGSTKDRSYQHELPCQAEGCPRNAVTAGYCTRHYGRKMRYGDTTVRHTRELKGTPCHVNGCQKEARSLHLCSTHYANFHYYRERNKYRSADEYIRAKNQTT